MLHHYLLADVPTFALDLTLRATIILACAGIAALALQKASAALRHMVWLAAVLALLALPLMTQTLPTWRALPSWTAAKPTPSPAPISPAPLSELPSPPTDFVFPTMPRTSVAAPALPLAAPTQVIATAPAPRDTTAAWLITFWATGTFIMLQPLLVARVAIARLLKRSVPCENVICRQAVEEACRQLRIQRPVTVLQARGPGSAAIPMAFGIRRAHILLPAASSDWTPAQWRMVLRHELAHIHRRDLLTQLLAQLMRALYWFHPLAWLACARMAAERERACDDLVLTAGFGAAEYAEQVLAAATASTHGTWLDRASTPAATPMARLSALEGRLRALLDATKNRRRVTGVVALATLLLALGILLPVATLAAAAPKTPATSTQPQPAKTLPAKIPTPVSATTPAEDAVYQAELAIAKAQTEDTAQLDAEMAVLAQKKLDYEKLSSQVQIGKVTQADADSAKLEIAVAEARARLAQSEHAQALLKYEAAKARYQAYLANPGAARVTATSVEQPPSLAEDEAILAIAKEKAEDTSGVDAQLAMLEQKKIAYQRLAGLGPQVVSREEVDTAKLEVTVAEARVKAAQSDHKQDQLAYDLAKARFATKQTARQAATAAATASAADRTSAAKGDGNVYVMGEVEHPGVYTLGGQKLTALRVAVAAGLKNSGGVIKIIHTTGDKEEHFQFFIDFLLKDDSKDYVVADGDVLNIIPMSGGEDGLAYLREQYRRVLSDLDTAEADLAVVKTKYGPKSIQVMDANDRVTRLSKQIQNMVENHPELPLTTQPATAPATTAPATSGPAAPRANQFTLMGDAVQRPGVYPLVDPLMTTRQLLNSVPLLKQNVRIEITRHSAEADKDYVLIFYADELKRDVSYDRIIAPDDLITVTEVVADDTPDHRKDLESRRTSAEKRMAEAVAELAELMKNPVPNDSKVKDDRRIIELCNSSIKAVDSRLSDMKLKQASTRAAASRPARNDENIFFVGGEVTNAGYSEIHGFNLPNPKFTILDALDLNHDDKKNKVVLLFRHAGDVPEVKILFVNDLVNDASKNIVIMPKDFLTVSPFDPDTPTARKQYLTAQRDEALKNSQDHQAHVALLTKTPGTDATDLKNAKDTLAQSTAYLKGMTEKLDELNAETKTP